MHKVFSRSVKTVVDVTSFILEWALVPIVFVFKKLEEHESEVLSKHPGYLEQIENRET